MSKTFSAILPQQAYDAKQVQSNEAQIAKQCGIAMFDLMSMAGKAVFELCQQVKPNNQHFLIVAGKGNNGGDGFIVAALAIAEQKNVELILLCSSTQLKGDALTAFQQLTSHINAKAYLTITELDLASTTAKKALTLSAQAIEIIKQSRCELIIDAIFGTGFRGELTPEYADICAALNIKSSNNLLKCQSIETISIDVPSGVNATSGEVADNAIVASNTATFIAIKKGQLTGQAKHNVGKLYFASLELGKAFSEKVKPTAELISTLNLPHISNRKVHAHKGTIGQLLLIGGNEYFPGAIKMTAEAALRSGAALVSVSCHQTNRDILLHNRPEIMLAPYNADTLFDNNSLGKVKAIAIGPGLGQNQWAINHFNTAISAIKQRCLNAVIDADALTLLAQSPIHYDNWVLTPHPGEAARLLNSSVKEIEKDRFAAVEQIQRKYGGVCLLKGAGTLICNGKQMSINTTGNPSMASGGMGDVLTGIIAALLLHCQTSLQATQLAVFIHGLAADKIVQQQGEIGILASDIIEQLPVLLNQIAITKS